MVAKYSVILLVVLMACGGRLTDEQRKKLKEGMKLQEIKKISEAQMTEAAFVFGRSLADVVEKMNITRHHSIDSLQRLYKVTIFPLRPGDSSLLVIERQIIEAYSAGAGQVQLHDNVQHIGTDSVLYTKPVMHELPDGSLQFAYALGIRIPKKQVVLSIRE
jgi:hypothetical protein